MIVRVTALAVALVLAPGARAARTLDELDPTLAIEDIRPEVIFHEHLYEGAFESPGGVFCDRDRGEIYVADTGAHRIGIFDLRGMPLFSFSDAEHLREPRRVAVMKDGRILVSDQDRSRIKIFSYRGEFLSHLVPPGSDAAAPILGAVTVDAEGNVYVGDDAAGQVVVFDRDLKYRFRFGTRGEEQGQFRSIGAIAVAEKAIAVVDHVGTPVQLFDRAGNFLRGWGAHDMGAQNFSLPVGVAIDEKGRVIVVDALRHEIKAFQQDGKFIGRFGGVGRGPGNVTYPSDVAVDGEGRLVVSENVGGRVQLLRAEAPRDAPGGGPMEPAAREPPAVP